jgi:hypothetical protein
MYCQIHETNNCLECAIEAQTREIVKAIDSLKSDQRRMQEQQAQKSNKPSMLCRMIGHKWVWFRPVKSWGDEASTLIIFGCCTRCGKPTPDDLTDVLDPTDYELARPHGDTPC